MSSSTSGGSGAGAVTGTAGALGAGTGPVSTAGGGAPASTAPAVPTTNNSVIQTTTAQRAQTQSNVSNFTNLTTQIAAINANNALSSAAKAQAVSDLKNASTKSGVQDPNGGTGTQNAGQSTQTLAPQNQNGTQGAGVTLPAGTTAVTLSSTDNPTTGQPAGAVGYTTDANGNKVWTDANGNTLKDATDPMGDIKGQISTATANANAQITSLQSTLSASIAYTDSSTAATIQQLQSMYSDRMTSINNAYTALGAKQNENNIRTGLDRYAPVQAQGILTDTEVQGQLKISDLMTQMTSAITKAQNAQEDSDTKSFNSAATEISTIQKNLADTVNSLYKEANTYQQNQIKAQQAQAKAAQTAMTSSITNAKNVAPSIAAELADVTNPDQQQQIIASLAKQYGLDPGLLSGYVKDAMTKNSKSGSKKTTGGGTDGAYTYTPADIASYTNLMNTGGKDPEGNVLNPRGSDGFVDPGTFIGSYNDWIKNGGTNAGFLKQFPVKGNVNPESYSMLPAALQPATEPAKTASSSPQKI